MTSESFTLHGKHVRLEPLEHRHVDGLVAAAGDAALYQWSPVPRGKVEATGYVETPLAWRDAGTALPFATIRCSGKNRCEAIKSRPTLSAQPLCE
jgi:N-acetyltransferase